MGRVRAECESDDMMHPIMQAAAEAIVAQVDLTPLSGKNVLLLGATGVIGQHLRNSAEMAGAIVTPPHREFSSAHIFDYVIHAAGYGQPARFLASPIETIRVNTQGLSAALNAVRPGGSLLYLSSSEVYSGLWTMEHEERQIGTTTPWHARGCYIEAKRCGEAIIAAARNCGVDAKAARVSLGYGPGARPGDARVIYELIDRALSTGEVFLLDEGLAVRCYGYITDVVAMLWNVLLRGKEPVYNVAGDSYCRIAGLAKLIAGITGARLVGIPHDAPLLTTGLSGAPDHVKMSLRLYAAEFPLPAFVPLEEGVRRTVEYHRTRS